MRPLLFILLLSLEPLLTNDCTYNGHKLYGRVEYVQHFEDIRVKVVKDFADLDVKIVNRPATQCGEWQMVDKDPDLRVKIVQNGEDIRIKYVSDFPGKE
jgi:hypothetical protein